MRVIACLTRLPGEWRDLKSMLEELPATVIQSESPGDLLQSLGAVDPDIFLFDSRSPRRDVEMLLDLTSPSVTVVGVLPGNARDDAAVSSRVMETPGVYDWLHLSDTLSNKLRVVQRALERSGLVQRGDERSTVAPVQPLSPGANRGVERTWDMALHSLSRTLSAGFDSNELIEPFLDLVTDLAGVARAALLMHRPDKLTLHVVASRGLHGPMLRAAAFPVRSGLMALLLREGRPIRRDDPVLSASPNHDTVRAFEALQATVCIPLAAHGNLLAVLALGSRLNGQPVADEHVEMLFAIGTHVAAALQNVRLHQAMERQKIQSDSVLEHMTNGIAAIDEDCRVTMFNRRASEILGLKPGAVLGCDLRVLPAPLGDLLFGAMQTGEVSKPSSITVAGSGLPVEVCTYPLVLMGEGRPVGSVLVLEDISERLALEQTRREADRHEVFNRLVSQLAHEIKNPLVAVKTFADLFPGHFSDSEFISFVKDAVIPEIRRLDEMAGKLVDFVSQVMPDMRRCDLGPVICSMVAEIAPGAASSGIAVVARVDDGLPTVRADEGLLSRALSYVVEHLVESMPKGEDSCLDVCASSSEGSRHQVMVEFKADRPWVSDEDAPHLFDPLFVQRGHLNLALPAARKIIQEHRGDIELYRDSSTGACGLRMTCPAAEPETQPGGPPGRNGKFTAVADAVSRTG